MPGSALAAGAYVPFVRSLTCWRRLSSSAVWTLKPSRSSVVPAVVPTPTVRIRTPSLAATWAASTGSGRSLFSPSLKRTIAASEWLPGATGAGVAVGSGERLL